MTAQRHPAGTRTPLNRRHTRPAEGPEPCCNTRDTFRASSYWEALTTIKSCFSHGQWILPQVTPLHQICPNAPITILSALGTSLLKMSYTTAHFSFDPTFKICSKKWLGICEVWTSKRELVLIGRKTMYILCMEKKSKQCYQRVRFRWLVFRNTGPSRAPQSCPHIRGHMRRQLGVRAPDPPYHLQSLDMTLGIPKCGVTVCAAGLICPEKLKNIKYSWIILVKITITEDSKGIKNHTLAGEMLKFMT